jgi:hypothetical protein
LRDISHYKSFGGFIGPAELIEFVKIVYGKKETYLVR